MKPTYSFGVSIDLDEDDYKTMIEQQFKYKLKTGKIISRNKQATYIMRSYLKELRKKGSEGVDIVDQTVVNSVDEQYLSSKKVMTPGEAEAWMVATLSRLGVTVK